MARRSQYYHLCCVPLLHMDARKMFFIFLFLISIAGVFTLPYSRLASSDTKLHNYTRNSPDLLPSYGTLSDRAYGKPDKLTGERVALWNPYTHRMNPEELGRYEKGDILINREPPARNGLVAASSRWPNGIIPYWIEGHFNDEELKTLYSAMQVFHTLTCIHFVPWSGEFDYLNIESTDTGCWSSVGRIGGKQSLNLQTPACVWGVGTALHELMHTIGFYHEQSRYERDRYVQIFWKNVIPGQEYNFMKFSPSIALSKVPYDFNSVMHYSGIAFSSSDKPTMKSKVKGITLGQRDFLSERDVKKLRLMYKCNGDASNV